MLGLGCSTRWAPRERAVADIRAERRSRLRLPRGGEHSVRLSLRTPTRITCSRDAARKTAATPPTCTPGVPWRC